MSQIWQLASGDSEREYHDVLTGYDLICIGPGDPGPFDEAKYISLGTLTRQRHAQLKSFHQEIRPGDTIVLRAGKRVVAVGIVSQDNYVWNSTFDDVFGWDLQHTRRVIWQDHLVRTLDEIQRSSALFGDRYLIPTLTRLKDAKVLGPIRELLSEFKERPLKALPAPLPAPLSLEDLGQALFELGLSNRATEDVLEALGSQRRLSKWYARQGARWGRPTEREVVTYFVVPLLRALGWSEQLVAVEWMKTDVAAFDGTPTTRERCVLLCEAKGLGHGLRHTLDQPMNYTSKKQLTRCNTVVTTEGSRLFVYLKSVPMWTPFPAGYINIHKLRTRHLLSFAGGAAETLLLLTPAAVASRSGPFSGPTVS